MPFRERVRRAFNRPSYSGLRRTNRNGIKLEYYRFHEVPKSKFKGPFDPEHQKQLEEWSFGAAMAPRRRSLDLSLSPCTSLPDYSRPQSDQSREVEEEAAPDQVRDEVQPQPQPDVMETVPTVTQIEDTAQRQADGGSQSSTMVDPDSFSGSVMTLLPEDQRETLISTKENIRYTSPAMWSASPPPAKAGAYMPFSPEDLTRALNAVRVY